MKLISIKTAVFGIAFLSFSLISNAQQDPLFSQYFWNPITINPGYAGSTNTTRVFVAHRNQWTSIEGAPKTNILSVTSPIFSDNFAFGGTVINDKIGPTTQFGMYLDFTARINVGPKARIAFGLKPGFNHLQTAITSLDINQGGDPNYSENINRFLPNIGAGIYFDMPKFYAGLSVPKVFENQFLRNVSNTDIASTEKRHFYFITGGIIDITNDIAFRPSYMFRSVNGAPISMDFNGMFLFSNRVWAGGYYRLNESVGLCLGYQITPNLRLGYSYDYILNDLSRYSDGSHEFSLSYDIPFGDYRIDSPRYF